MGIGAREFIEANYTLEPRNKFLISHWILFLKGEEKKPGDQIWKLLHAAFLYH